MLNSLRLKFKIFTESWVKKSQQYNKFQVNCLMRRIEQEVEEANNKYQANKQFFKAET